VLYPTVSGSEANDLALRIAHAAAARLPPPPAAPDAAPAAAGGEGVPERKRAAPAALHVAVLDHAYHGHTAACIDLSPYKFKGPGGGGRPPHVHVLPCPDTYRGTGLDGAAAARAAIASAERAGARIAAFFAESLVSCGGQVVLPPGYLAGVYGEMRAHGAVCVADEVQCGFGRVGAAFWAFQLQGVTPDIVTFGKPCGNGERPHTSRPFGVMLGAHPRSALLCRHCGRDAAAWRSQHGMCWDSLRASIFLLSRLSQPAACRLPDGGPDDHPPRGGRIQQRHGVLRHIWCVGMA
jgi:4-aminobutyrate aminotransferase-like enzyme